MGYLDAFATAGGADQAQVDLIEAQLLATQNVIAALQAEVDSIDDVGPAHAAAIAALQTSVGTLTTQLAAVSVSNDTQQIALDAAAALAAANEAAITITNAANAAQQSAIDAVDAAATAAAAAVAANTAVDSTQAAAITSLQNTVLNLESIPEVNIRMFVPNRTITDANIDDAIDAAIAMAKTMTGPGFKGPAPRVRVPAGKWTPSRGHVFTGFAEANRCMIGLVGAGKYETVFLATDESTSAPMFTFGNASTVGPDPWIQLLHVSDFSIVAVNEENCLRTGIRLYCAVKPLIERVSVRGLASGNGDYDQCRGIEILPALGAGVPINSQFVAIRDSEFGTCNTGLYIRTSYPVMLDNVHCESNHFANAVFDGTHAVWRNSGAQYNGNPVVGGAYLDRWHGGINNPGMISGFSHTTGLPSGTGATCAVAASNLCLVTGLTGANLTTHSDRGRWLRLNTAGLSANELKVRGMYKIESIVSATSCYIRKGSNHTSQGSLTWQVCQSQSGNELTFDFLYDEAVNRIASYGFYRDSVGSGAYVVRRPMSFIAGGYIVESDGVSRVRVEEPPITNIHDVARIRLTRESFVDAVPSRVQVDDFSHPGYRGRSTWQKALPGVIPSDDRVAYAYRDSAGGFSARVRTALQELGFLEVWDARVTSSINIVGADARTWTGLLKGTVLSPTTAGLYPLYTPDDPLFGGPCITMVAGTHLTGRSFKGAIAAANLPTYPYLCTIFTVARMESVVAPGSEVCRIQVSTADASQYIAFNDALWTAGVYGMNEGTGIGNAVTAFTPAIDTDPHAYVFGRSPDSTNVVSTDHGEDFRMHNFHTGGFVGSHTPGANLDVVVGGIGTTYSHRAFRTSIVGLKVGTLSHAEHRKLIDLSRNEWPLEA